MWRLRMRFLRLILDDACDELLTNYIIHTLAVFITF